MTMGGDLRIFVTGTPKPQPRARFAKGHAYTPKTGIAEWKRAIIIKIYEAQAKNKELQTPRTDAVMLSLDFYFPWPKSKLKNYPHYSGIPVIKRPDLDNLIKAVMDSLTYCNYWEDDCQVTELTASKYYSMVPGVDIRACKL